MFYYCWRNSIFQLWSESWGSCGYRVVSFQIKHCISFQTIKTWYIFNLFVRFFSNGRITYFQTRSSYDWPTFLPFYTSARLSPTANRQAPPHHRRHCFHWLVCWNPPFSLALAAVRRLAGRRNQGRQEGSHVDTKITSIFAATVPPAYNGDDGASHPAKPGTSVKGKARWI